MYYLTIIFNTMLWIFFRAKASPSKQATVAFPGLNYDITRFASIVRVGNGYCGINIEKIEVSPRTRKPTDLSGFWLNIYIYIHSNLS